MSRTATKSAARRRREDAANKSGRAQACPDGAPSGAPYFREGMRAYKKQWLRPLARHPPHHLRGDNGKTGLPGASPNNTGDDACFLREPACRRALLVDWLFEM